MTNRHAFVAEVAVDLKDPFEAADDEALQIEFRRDAQVHVHVERVVMRHEGLGVGAARDRVEHRRFDFEEAVREHVVADRGDRLRAREEALARLFVHDEVDVALAIAHFRVAETLVLVGKRTDVLRHQTQFARADREFAALRAKERPPDGDDVAEVPGLEVGVGFFADVGGRDEVLHFAREVAHGGEARLAHDALQHHAARAGDFGSGSFEFLGGHFAVLGAQIAEEVFAMKVVRIGDALFAQAKKLGAAFRDDVVFVFRRKSGVLNLFFGHGFQILGLD